MNTYQLARKGVHSILSKSILIAGVLVLLFVTALTSPQRAEAQTTWRLKPIFPGVDDPNNVPVGNPIDIRCAFTDGVSGGRNTHPNGTTLAAVDPELILDRQPNNGFNGSFNGISARGHLTEPGLYVFRCAAGNQQALGAIDNSRPGVAVGRAPQLGRATAELVSSATGTLITEIEAGSEFDIRAKAFSTTLPERVIKPSNRQILFRPGNASCNSGGGNANGNFSFGTDRPWTEANGHVRRFTAKTPGSFTAIVSQLDGAGGSKCAALPLRVRADLNPPKIRLIDPKETHQMNTGRDTMRISGVASDTGSGITKVVVSNGHWSEDARLFDGNRPGEKRFFADLPFARGLNLITVTAEDGANRKSRYFESLYAGSQFVGVTGSGYQGNREVRLQLGRDLIDNQKPGLDSFGEIADLIPTIITLIGGLDALAPVDVNREIDSNFVRDVRNLIVPDFTATGTIIPGQLSFSLRTRPMNTAVRGDAFDLRLRIPVTGRIRMTCDGVSLGWERLICAVGGSSSGNFDVSISGSITASIPIQTTTIGGLSAWIVPEDITISDNLSISNGLNNNGTINNNFRSEIVDNVKNGILSGIWPVFGCPSEASPAGTRCTPELPLTTMKMAGSDARPQFVGFMINEGNSEFEGGLSLPGLPPRGATISAEFGALIDTLEVQKSRLDVDVSPRLRAQTRPSADGFLGAMIDPGMTQKVQTRQLEDPKLSALFGSGNRDVQGVIHRNILNEALASYWASGALKYRENLFTVLDNAGFFGTNNVTKSLAQSAFVNAYLDVEFGAPPRLTTYDGAPDLYAEIGDARLTFDLNQDFNSEMVFEAALITRLSLGSADDKITIGLSDPTGCTPDGRRFLNCKGRFEIGLRSVKGFTDNDPRSQAFQADALYNGLLTAMGLRTNDTASTHEEIENFYEDALSGAVSNITKTPFEFALPDIPVPSFSLGALNLAPIKISKFNFHRRAKGGRFSDGWIGFTFDLEARPPN